MTRWYAGDVRKKLNAQWIDSYMIVEKIMTSTTLSEKVEKLSASMRID